MEESRAGGWWFHRWAGWSVAAGITTRHLDGPALLGDLPASLRTVEAEQVHGGSVAIIPPLAAVAEGRSAAADRPAGPAAGGGIVGQAGVSAPVVPGCDALLTAAPGVALLIRTADCLPIFFADPMRRVVGIAHAGWRGLAAGLPARVVAAFRHVHHSRIEELQVAIGPAIRACCYEVGPEFVERFGPFVQERSGRRTCDLIGLAIEQLRRCGIPPGHIMDTGHCTACEPRRWYSLRREGSAAGRLVSLIVLRP